MPCGWRRPPRDAGFGRPAERLRWDFCFRDASRTAGAGLLFSEGAAHRRLPTLLPREDRDPESASPETSGQACRPPRRYERPDPELIRVRIPKGRDLCTNTNRGSSLSQRESLSTASFLSTGAPLPTPGLGLRALCSRDTLRSEGSEPCTGVGPRAPAWGRAHGAQRGPAPSAAAPAGVPLWFSACSPAAGLTSSSR